ncbi:MAG: hypothetical protein KF902_05380 [Phycisphaeraceae bacterium]|nr:hypothetical protein [Phycisphaeraceae bacterium]MCW5768263.1 hypothetical protein [Phycisphaeraceae bacterium]
MNYQQAVTELAKSHQQADQTIAEIWASEDPSGTVVRLIEVSAVPLPPENGVMSAVRFGASSDFPYPSEIALLSFDDWKRYQSGTLRLPPGWTTPRKVG